MSAKRTRRLDFAFVVAATFVVSFVVARPALAQTSQSGPLVLTPIPSSVVFSPSVEVTTVNHDRSEIVGAYVGRLMDRSLLIGGGLYWLANPRDDAHLTYGGIVLGWKAHDGSKFDLGVHGLVGIGSATFYANGT